MRAFGGVKAEIACKYDVQPQLISRGELLEAIVSKASSEGQAVYLSSQ